MRAATEVMANEKIYVLIVQSTIDNKILGVISYKDIIDTIQGEDKLKNRSISLKRQALKVAVRGKNLFRNPDNI